MLLVASRGAKARSAFPARWRWKTEDAPASSPSAQRSLTGTDLKPKISNDYRCIYTRLSLTASFTSRKYCRSNDMFEYLTATDDHCKREPIFFVPAYFIFCAYQNLTLSAGRAATRRSGTESPSRSGSKTACDSMSSSWTGHRVFPGE